MFNIFKKKDKVNGEAREGGLGQQKDPICGMIANKNFISKYGEKFCAEACVKTYEKEHKIDKNATPHSCCK